jgi:uncharacterized membrane protein
LRRLACSEHRGKLDLAMRLIGLLLLGVPYSLTRFLWLLHQTPVPHRTLPHEFALACVVLLSFWMASLLLVAGAALLRPVPKPPRPLYS